MKYLLILMMLIAGNCFGQTDKTALERAKDYLNYKITYGVLIERHKQSAVTKDQLDAVTKEMKDVDINNISDYDRMSDLLFNAQLTGALDNIADPINKIDILQFINLTPEMAASELTTRSFEALKINYPAIYDTIAKNKKELTENVNRFLIANSRPPSPEDSIKTDTPGINGGGKGKVQPQPYTMLNLILNIISILAIIGVFFYFRKEHVEIYKKLKMLTELYEDKRDNITRLRKEELMASWNKNDNNGLLNTSDLENAIINSTYFQKMAAEMEVLKKLQMQQNKPNRSSYSQPEPVMEKTVGGDIFYMAGPVNNYFPNSAKSMRKEETVYKFTINANKQEATFETHTAGAPVSEIVKRNESYLKPACEEENLPDHNTKNIITKRKGIAVLEGDKWVIKTKAVIRYE